jgi:hypothetical protein
MLINSLAITKVLFLSKLPINIPFCFLSNEKVKENDMK